MFEMKLDIHFIIAATFMNRKKIRKEKKVWAKVFWGKKLKLYFRKFAC